MSSGNGNRPRREHVERNIFKRANARGQTLFEVGFRYSAGRQGFRTVQGGITAARAERDAILGDKGRGREVRPNPRLTFGDAASQWLTEQAAELRPGTQASYRNSVEQHLRPRWGRRRLDELSVDDVARLVRELRAQGKAESTIATILRAGSRVFKFARRRMNWHGTNPVTELESGRGHARIL